jgi:hypothetical protein
MIRRDLGVSLVVVSHGRAANVARMTERIGPATWIVAPEEADAYRAAGAAVGPGAKGLCPNRNAALRYAWSQGYPALEISDDLRQIEGAVLVGDKPKAVPLAFADAVRELRDSAKAVGAKLAGGPPTSNAFYFNPRVPVSTAGFIIGDLLYVEPCDLLFDGRFRVKEDYDYTLQHLQRFGRIARVNRLLFTFQHYSNAGGVVDDRSDAVEAEAVRQLKAKWGPVIKDHPKRPNEILLDLGKKRSA